MVISSLLEKPSTKPLDNVCTDTDKFDKGIATLCIVVPTRNESGNIAPLVDRISTAMAGRDVEVLFVDDSTDDTPAAILAVAQVSDITVRLLHREPAKRTGGLSGAVVAGLRHTKADWVVVMDGDLQHPPEDLPRLLDPTVLEDHDVVIASRYRGGGSSRGLSSRVRRLVSSGSTTAAKLAFPVRLRGVTDPMTGFFAVRRDALDLDDLTPRGFKILLEVLVRASRPRACEIPFTFAERATGESKASWREGVLYLRQLIGLRAAAAEGIVRFAKFAVVGLSGVVVNLVILGLLLWLGVASGIRSGGMLDAAIAVQFAILSNFILSETWVFSDRGGKWRRRLPAFWLLGNIALAGQLIVAAQVQSVFGSSYFISTAVAVFLVSALRFDILDRLLYRRSTAAIKHTQHAVEVLNPM
jgi:dolichol-phosphate mannosyltransferase